MIPQILPPVTWTDPVLPDSALEAGRRAREQRDAEQAFQKAARDGSVYVGGQIIQKPGGRIEILGTAQERFDFSACLNRRGQPMDTLREACGEDFDIKMTTRQASLIPLGQVAHNSGTSTGN